MTGIPRLGKRYKSTDLSSLVNTKYDKPKEYCGLNVGVQTPMLTPNVTVFGGGPLGGGTD